MPGCRYAELSHSDRRYRSAEQSTPTNAHACASQTTHLRYLVFLASRSSLHPITIDGALREISSTLEVACPAELLDDMVRAIRALQALDDSVH
jgi:hypothetical protein